MPNVKAHAHDDHDDHDDHDQAHDEHAHDTQNKQAHDDHDHAKGDHDHGEGTGLGGLLGRVFHLHGHAQQRSELASDPAFSGTEEGIRTVWLALAALGITSLIQIIIVTTSGSVALLADTVHNIGDALNSIPLLVAFYLARRAATRRYTYCFARAEDVAGVIIVLSIVFSAGLIFYESIGKLFNPQPLTNLGWIVAAAVIGFVGNETVAWLQIRTGKRIGSAALVADGQHARTDGYTSLAVLVAALGSWLGFPIADPIIGLIIGVVILFIARDATVTIWYRLMDAVDPELVAQIEGVAVAAPDVQAVPQVRVRWMGHTLHAELRITVDEDLPTRQSHQIAEQVRHDLFHALPRLSGVTVHTEPCGHGGGDHHALTADHVVRQ